MVHTHNNKKNNFEDDSTASCHSYDENQVYTEKCPHVKDCVDLNNIRHNLKIKNLTKGCSACTKENNNILKSEIPKDLDHGIWFCLKCGYQGCAVSEQNHANAHTTHPHIIGLHLLLWKVFCFECKIIVKSTTTNALSKSLKFIKKKYNKFPQNNHQENTSDKNYFKKANNTIASRSIRGLTNNGNTCYINVILQCLAQTPYFRYILESININETTVSMPGDCETQREPIVGKLGKNGLITQFLLETIHEINSKQKLGSFNPTQLINKVKQKCVQFRDYDQQDAHEFIRQLLDLIKTEDLQRYWRIILHSFGLNEKTNPSNVNTNSKELVKFYGTQASELYLHPDDVFKGKLVSIVQCETCENISYKTESFLDLSLPINENKPHPPMARRKAVESDDSHNFKSKKLSKKEKRIFRKQYKKNNRNSNILNLNDTSRIVEEYSSSFSVEQTDSIDNIEEIDADIEDNVEEKNSPNGLDQSNMNGLGESNINGSEESNMNGSQESNINGPEESNMNTPEESNINGPEESNINAPVKNPILMVLKNPILMVLCEESNINAPEESNINAPEESCNVKSIEEQVNNVEISISPKEDEQLNKSIDNERLSNSTNTHINGNPQEEASIQILNPDCYLTPPNSENDSFLPTLYVSDSNPSTPPSGGPERPLSRISFYNEEKNNLQNGMFSLFDQEQKKNNEEKTEENSKCTNINETTTKNNSISPDDKDKIIINSLANDINKNLNLKNENDKDKKLLFKTISTKSFSDEESISLESCLNRFTSMEMMTGSNKVVCPNCSKNSENSQNVLTNSIKQLLLSQAPPVLILHLKRFYFDEFSFKKILTHVKFNMSLDISPFCSTKFKSSLLVNPDVDSEIPYQLYAIIEHRGSLDNGHYIAYVKVSTKNRNNIYPQYWKFFNISELQSSIHNFCLNDSNESNNTDFEWYYISDTEVKKVTEDRVLSASAYILFYERIFKSSAQDVS